MSKKKLFRGTLILTCSGLITRFIGFFYRIFLSHSIGAQELGIYNLTVPLQMLVLAITTFGIQTTLSRQIASYIAIGKQKEAKDYFIVGTGIAFLLSSLFSFILYNNHIFIATTILKEPQTASLIHLVALGLPLSTIHICINSYYFAQKETVLPSSIQLLEQVVRVSVTYLIYLIFLSDGRKITSIIAAGGSLASECAAALVSILAIGIHFHKHAYSLTRLTQPLKKAAELFRLSLPLSTNRILITLLSSIEVVLIPHRLRMSGLSSSDALGIYGVFTGMVMPLILFPSTITNSASVMLMPSIAQLNALGRKKRIRYVTSRTSMYCITLGSICTLIFSVFGNILGDVLFNSPTAGIYIRTISFICPFLYLNTMLSSILNGLGKTVTCLIHSIIGLSIRISFVFFAVPLLGIRGYFYGILISELVLTFMHFFALFSTSKKND